MPMRLPFKFFTAIPLAMAAQLSGADTIPPCQLASGVEERLFPADVPLPLKQDLDRRIGDLALAGEDFDNTDIKVTGRRRRLIFARSKGTRWVIATEHGGAIYNDPIFAYDVSDDGLAVTFVIEATAFPGSVCKAANKLLGSD